MGYFKIENEEAQQKLEDVIEQVKVEILHCLGNRGTIILLIGGFARGEGAWKKVNKQLRIVSDLDLLVSTKPGTRVPAQLGDRVRDIENRTGVAIDTRIRTSLDWRFAPRDTEFFDIQDAGITIHGENEGLALPAVKKEELGFGNILYLFFNRVYHSIDKCSPGDFFSPDDGALERLSYVAAHTMFTCADFVAIHYGNYLPSVFDRVEFAESKLPELAVETDKALFLQDLRMALRFKFSQTDRLYLENAPDFVLRARGHLLDLFSYLFALKYDASDIARYPYFQGRDFSLRARALVVVSRLRRVLRIAKMKRMPSFRGIPNSHYLGRMVSLMLYQALGDELQVEYLPRAERYLSRVYVRRARELDPIQRWVALRDEIRRLRESGVV